MTLPSPLLVFDLDGTLADTAPDLIATLNVILSHEGLPALALEEARDMIGVGARALISRGLAAAGVGVPAAKLDALYAAFLGHYEAHIADASTLYPGVVTALDRFAAAGWRFAVCTNKLEHAAKKLLAALDVADRFEAICGQNTFSVSKPHGAALLKTIARAGGLPARSVMVGDSKTDILTARNAAVPVVAVTFGYTDVPVATFGPDRMIGHFDDLWAAVASLPRERAPQLP